MGIQREPLNLEESLRNFYLLLRNSNQSWNGMLGDLLCTPSPKSLSRSQPLLCLAGVQLDPRASCALRWPERPLDSSNICENEPDESRKISEPLGGERIGRPKKGVTVLAHWASALSFPTPCFFYMEQSCLLGEAQPRAGAPSSLGRRRQCPIPGKKLSSPDSDGTGLSWHPPGQNSDLWLSAQIFCNPFREKPQSHPAHGGSEQ